MTWRKSHWYPIIFIWQTVGCRCKRSTSVNFAKYHQKVIEYGFPIQLYIIWAEVVWALHFNFNLITKWMNLADQCVKFDFEHGISDWTKTGKAFDNQPTYGDNPTARGRDQPANLKGDWWIGGAEDRPSPASPAGAMQGDDPQGTLTSPTFRIMGKKLSFLIGGGCNASTVYAELLIDQVPVFKATGSCSETMEERHWDVSAHHGKEAQIRLVDNDSGGWGHINFDHMIDEHCQQSDPIPPWCIARSMHRRPFSTLSKFRFGWRVLIIAGSLVNSFDGWWLYHTEANRLGFWKVPVLLPLSAGETECAGFVVFRYYTHWARLARISHWTKNWIYTNRKYGANLTQRS